MACSRPLDPKSTQSDWCDTSIGMDLPAQALRPSIFDSIESAGFDAGGGGGGGGGRGGGRSLGPYTISRLCGDWVEDGASWRLQRDYKIVHRESSLSVGFGRHHPSDGSVELGCTQGGAPRIVTGPTKSPWIPWAPNYAQISHHIDARSKKTGGRSIGRYSKPHLRDGLVISSKPQQHEIRLLLGLSH